MRRSILAVVVAVLALFFAGAALADTFSAVTITLTSKTAKLGTVKPPPGVICGTCDGSGYAACGSAWVDKHYDTWTGSYGIHGSVSWCWNESSVWNASFLLAPWASATYSVNYYNQWGTGPECGGGAAVYSYAGFRWEPFPDIGTNYNMDATTSVCPGGWGVIR